MPPLIVSPRTRARLCAVALAPLLAMAAACQRAEPEAELAWWDSGWTGRMKVAVDTTAEGVPLDPAAAPGTVLVRLHGGNFPFAEAQPDGRDIRFVDPDHRSAWPHHIERYDDLLEEAFIWVRLPAIPAGERLEFWLYHGNPEAFSGRDPAQVFGEDMALVYHFGETWVTDLVPDGIPPLDATGQGHHGTSAGLPVESALIGGGIRLNRLHEVEISAAPGLAWRSGDSASLSLWVAPEGRESGASVFRREGSGALFDLGLDDGVPYLEILSPGQGASGRLAADEAVAEDAWSQLAVVADAGSVSLWADGQLQGTLEGGLPAFNGPIQLASRSGAGQYSGQMDELRLARRAWTEGDIAFAWVNQGPTPRSARLVSLEPDQPASSVAMNPAGSGYFRVIVDTLSWDGWTIIGILALMSLASWMVILFKAARLRAVERCNAQFVRVWNRVADDLGALDQPEKIDQAGLLASHPVRADVVRRSPLYHLYRTGWEQVGLRLSKGKKGQAKLTALAVQAVRASMFATCIRETDKLHAKLVFLTIAISGAPFLGLLGTVLGVTVTFASIAAAGEVNVNTIAPGIAAALTTTIVGLCVAIPALFGYNYLVTPIKRMSSEMRVFVDEFISRAAEIYSRRSDPAPAQDHPPEPAEAPARASASGTSGPASSPLPLEPLPAGGSGGPGI